MAKKEVKLAFEQSLSRLEKIVEALEQGEVPLDESLKMYEEGIRLSKECLETLNTAEVRIKQLAKDLNGKTQLKEFED